MLVLLAGATLVAAWPILLIGTLVVVLSKVTAKSVAAVIPLVVLLPASAASGRDLSGYRSFSFGANLADVSRRIERRSGDATTIHERPARIEQVTWSPSSSPGSMRGGEKIQQVRFFFYDDALYKMFVTYDDLALRGLTAEDVQTALAAQYGKPTGRSGEIKDDYGRTERVLARWEDSQYSLNLFRSSLSNRLGLVAFAKSLDAKADAASRAAVGLEIGEASKKERARLKAEAEDMNSIREENLRTFLP